MKRSEVIRRLRDGWLEGTNGRSASGGLLKTLTDDSLVSIARALGVEVEEDEPELPSSIRLSSVGLGPDVFERYGDYSAVIQAGGRYIKMRPRDDQPVEAFARALVAAYNERGKGGWKSGLVPLDSSRRYVGYWRYTDHVERLYPDVRNHPDFWIRLPEVK